MPDETQHAVMIQGRKEVDTFDFNYIEEQKGFILAPYDSYADGKAFIIEPSFFIDGDSDLEQLYAFLEEMPDELPYMPQVEKDISDRDLYLGQVQKMIDHMKAGHLNKVVLSRILIKNLPVEYNIDLLFKQLCLQYPRAFVYVFHLPGEGVWIGATPETLLQKQGDYFETMALAGTQKKPDGTIPAQWGEKEIQEQQYVSDFIDSQLTNLGVSSFEKSDAETIFAGSLAHICTRFKIPFSELEGKTGDFIRSLHPTPAVCGIPKEKAWQLIAATEKHKRRFYTGFLGPWNLNRQSHLFVNLRCARILEKSLEVYVGGGLTADSVPEKEWQETLDKSQTILSAIENLRNFAS